MKKSLLTRLLAQIIAYPHIVIALVLLTIGFVRNPDTTIYAAVVVAAVLLGIRIAVPPVYRLAAAVPRLWATTVLNTWRLWDDRRAIRDSERNMRATVVGESQTLSDLGRSEDG